MTEVERERRAAWLVEHHLLSTTPHPVEEAERRGLEQAIENALGRLNRMQAMVIVARFGLRGVEPMTLKALGALLGKSIERVRQIEAKALHLLHGVHGLALRPYAEEECRRLERVERQRRAQAERDRAKRERRRHPSHVLGRLLRAEVRQAEEENRQWNAQLSAAVHSQAKQHDLPSENVGSAVRVLVSLLPDWDAGPEGMAQVGAAVECLVREDKRLGRLVRATSGRYVSLLRSGKALPGCPHTVTRLSETRPIS